MPDEKVQFKSSEPNRDPHAYGANETPVPKNGDVYADQREQRAEAEASPEASEDTGAEEAGTNEA